MNYLENLKKKNMDYIVMCLWRNFSSSCHTKVEQIVSYGCGKSLPFRFEIFYLLFYHMIAFYKHCWVHYNNMGLFCDSNIIANNKERSFQKPAVANHNSSQTLKLLRYHNICTCTIASPSQLRNLIQSQNFPIVTASIHCLRLTLHQKLFATHPSPQRLSESTQKSISFRYKI
jgi:hypothetical protein